jgi:hypothetical protein
MSQPVNLESIVTNHESHFMSDKLIKTVGCLAGMLATFYQRTHGANHPTTVGLQHISAKCADVRYVLRFHGGYSGLLVEILNMKTLRFLGGWKHSAARWFMYAQSAALMQYYICENAAYLGWTAPNWIGKKLERFGGANELGRVSCFGWGAWCAMEILSSSCKLKELARMQREVEETYTQIPSLFSPGKASQNKLEALRLIAKSRRALQYNVVRSVLFLIPDIQWCLKPGSRWAILPDALVKSMCLAEALLGYYTHWAGYGCSRPTLPDPNGREGSLSPAAKRGVYSPSTTQARAIFSSLSSPGLKERSPRLV